MVVQVQSMFYSVTVIAQTSELGTLEMCTEFLCVILVTIQTNMHADTQHADTQHADTLHADMTTRV